MVHHHPSYNILIKMLNYQDCSAHGNNHNLLQESRVADKPPFFTKTESTHPAFQRIEKRL